MRRYARIALDPQLTLERSIGHMPSPQQQPIRIEDDLARGDWPLVHSDDYAGALPARDGILQRSFSRRAEAET